ncbi:MAG: 4-Cys prefix domain-containing protein, partial [Chroococcales cyanobacterium]
MTYCLNLNCSQPENPDDVRFCLRCGCRVWLGDRIRPIKPISKEGIGRTFLAVDEANANKRLCVIKQLTLKGDDNKERLQEEVWRLQRLGEHRQIPALIAYFEAGENSMDAIAQEYIDGKSLTEIAATESQYDETQIRHLLNEML